MVGDDCIFNSILYLGILDKWSNKIYYWKMLFKAFMFHREAFGEAVSHMIFGYHFRKLLSKENASAEIT